jgi:hypothetical protein
MFFKKKKYCKQHCDLKSLQLLNIHLKHLKEEKKNLPQKFPNFCDYEIFNNRYNNYYLSREKSEYFYAGLFTLLSMSKLDSFSDDLVDFLDRSGIGPDRQEDFLRDMGNFFLNCSELSMKLKTININIAETEKQIKELKKKLMID